MISPHHNDPLAGHFDIEKTCKLWRKNTPVQLSATTLRPTRKAMTFVLPQKKSVTSSTVIFNLCLCKNTNRKTFSWTLWPVYQSQSIGKDNYDSILVIVDQLKKMIYYKPVKIIINGPGLVEVIIDVIVRHHGLLDSIVTNQGFLFTSIFWSSIC